jgi:hypothetical protein
MLAQPVPPASLKAESCFFIRRDKLSARAAPQEMNPAVLLFRHEPT